MRLKLQLQPSYSLSLSLSLSLTHRYNNPSFDSHLHFWMCEWECVWLNVYMNGCVCVRMRVYKWVCARVSIYRLVYVWVSIWGCANGRMCECARACASVLVFFSISPNQLYCSARSWLISSESSTLHQGHVEAKKNGSKEQKNLSLKPQLFCQMLRGSNNWPKKSSGCAKIFR